MKTTTLSAVVLGLGTALAVAAGFFLARPARADQPVKVVLGAKAFTESVVLGEMLAALARDAGADVDLKVVSGTGLVWSALKGGDIDAYVEYTGTLSTEILRGAGLRSNDLPGLRKELARFGIVMSYPLGFNNSYALGMTEAEAAKRGIRTISDLKAHPDLIVQVTDEFAKRPDGWPGLKARYGLPHKLRDSVDHILALKALSSGEIHVTDLYTTDAEIRQHRLKALDDDQGHFPRYQAVILMRADLEQRAPKVVEAFRKLEGAIDTETMTRLNAEAVVEKKPAAQVAVGYLNQSLGTDLQPAASSVWRDLWKNGVDHVYLVTLALAAAIIVSVPLGVVAYKVPAVGALVLGFVDVVQTIPSMALLVLLLSLPGFGLEAETAIAAMFLYSLLPIVRSTYTGLTTVPPNLKESAEVLGLPWFDRLWRVELPLAMPSILSGVRIAAVASVGTATIGALVGAGGYGQPILAGLRLDDTGLILQGAIPAALLALVVQGLFTLVEKWLVPAGLRLQPGH